MSNIFVNNVFYQILDKDFCLISKYPIDRLIFPYFDQSVDCSCSLFWMIFQRKIFPYDSYEEKYKRCINDEDFFENIIKCEFNRRLDDCGNRSKEKEIFNQLIKFIQPRDEEANGIRCFNGSKCVYIKRSNEIYCKKFDSFNELNFECPLITDKEYPNILVIQPNKKLILDSTFKIFQINYYIIKIVFDNLIGFELTDNPIRKLNNLLLLSIQNSIFDVYKEGRLLNESDCNELVYQNSDLFSQLKEVGFLFETLIRSPICPLLFKNSKLQHLIFYALNEKSILKFANYSSSIQLACSIYVLRFGKIHLKLDSNLLIKGLFEDVKDIQFESLSSLKIEKNEFSNLKSLKAINVIYDDVADLIDQYLADLVDLIDSKRNISITDYRKLNLNEEYKKVIYIRFNFKRMIEEKDFCIYAKYPINKLIFPEFWSFIECNCAVYWMIFQRKLAIVNDEAKHCLESKQFFKMVYRCDFDNRLKNCYSNYSYPNINNLIRSIEERSKLPIKLDSLAKIETIKITSIKAMNELIINMVRKISLVINSMSSLKNQQLLIYQ